MRIGQLGLIAGAVLLVAACSDDNNSSNTGTGGVGTGGVGTGTGGTPGACPSDGKVSITDATNYTFESTFEVKTTIVKDGMDLTFDWSGVTQDFFGMPLSATEDLDLVLVSLWGMTPDELAENLNRDNLPLETNKGAMSHYADGTITSASLASEAGVLTDFTFFANPAPLDEVEPRFDIVQSPPESHTFMVSAFTGTDYTEGTRMIGFFKLDPTSTNTSVVLDNTSAVVDWSADLQSLSPVQVPAGLAQLEIDWSNMTENALGNPYTVDQITQAVVAHYTMPVSDLEQQFLYLEERADSWYTGEVVAGTSIDLSTLQDSTGASFAGIDDTGVWLVALFCTETCNNPAPWSITILQPCQ